MKVAPKETTASTGAGTTGVEPEAAKETRK
jgi:hypothetical protein